MYAIAGTTMLIAMNSACNMRQHQQQLQVLPQRQYTREMQQMKTEQTPKQQLTEKCNKGVDTAATKKHKKWYKKLFQRQGKGEQSTENAEEEKKKMLSKQKKVDENL
ncbi:uncharacterized protein LOC111592187 isoform X2 [Drosophila hydei]|uniref:Uncharacterized protein LOC111592187 isoform X2 n=1 Tax=Drosophila hydei TaxID=7224 RepID=A0A6J1L5C1_DROHY|nr:uncharacterized protein LOC111592187 isoform X2 [Drosophila hydei]